LDYFFEGDLKNKMMRNRKGKRKGKEARRIKEGGPKKGNKRAKVGSLRNLVNR
jgi:hypothetical protein